MAFTRVHDPSLTQKDAPSTYRSAYENNVDVAHQLVTTNNWDSLALKADNVNPAIEALYQPTSNDLQTKQFKDILGKIGTSPIQWVSGGNYIAGQRVYITSSLDNNVYLCIQNITNSTNINNTNYWLKTLNYYTIDSLEYIYQQWIDRLKKQVYPLWSSGTIYYKNDIVNCASDNCIALCITKSLSGTTSPVTDTNNWVQLNLQGKQGEPAMGISYKGYWSNGETYIVKDMVIYQTNRAIGLYVANTNITSPNTPPNLSTQWTLVFEHKIPQIPIVIPSPSSFDYPYDGVFIAIDNEAFITSDDKIFMTSDGQIFTVGNAKTGQLYTSQLNFFNPQVLLNYGWTKNGDEYSGMPTSIYQKHLWDNTEELSPPYRISFDKKFILTNPNQVGAIMVVQYSDGTTQTLGDGISDVWEHHEYTLTKPISYIIGSYGTNNYTYWKNIQIKTQIKLFPKTNLSQLSFDPSKIIYSMGKYANIVIQDIYNHYNLG